MLTFLLSRSGWEIDYSVAVFIAGVVTAVVVDVISLHTPGYNEALALGAMQWERIDPNLIIFAFLPCLLFGESMTLSLHHVRKVFLSGSLLAIPGAAFSAYLIALLVSYASKLVTGDGTGWSWSLCWLVGSVLCATDPVAVVAVLNADSSSNKQKRMKYLIIMVRPECGEGTFRRSPCHRT